MYVLYARTLLASMFRRRGCGDGRQSNRVRYQTPYSSPIVPEPAPFFVRDLGENVSRVIAWTLNGYANIDTASSRRSIRLRWRTFPCE